MEPNEGKIDGKRDISEFLDKTRINDMFKSIELIIMVKL